MPINQQEINKLGGLFKAIEYPTPAIPTPKIVHKGSIISFHYVSQRVGQMIHDPYPLVLVSDIFSNAIRGVNLNYLTVPYVKNMINRYLDKPVNYAILKAQEGAYVVGSKDDPGAFRTYKRSGISQLRMMDSQFLIGIATVARTLAPNELDQIRMQIEELIKYQLNQPMAQPGAEIQGEPA
jgi:hypothetical protein